MATSVQMNSGQAGVAHRADLRPGAQRASQTSRLHSLDGLRGVAAAIVVIYHLTLVARPALDTGTGAWEWMTQSPLRVVTAGTEGVLVFFVLSGLVVTLPAFAGTIDWASYYTSRMLRLYLPVWGALLLAAGLILTLPRPASSAAPESWLLERNANAITVQHLLDEASLLPPSYTINNPLWSLRWEIIFSVLLPVFVVVALAVRRFRVIAVLLSVALMVVGRLTQIDALVYLPTFFLGTLLAANLAQVRAWADRVNAGARWRVWLPATLVSLTLLVLSWLARPIAPAGSLWSQVFWALSGVGAAGLVVVAIGSPAVTRVLSSGALSWLGRVSFSLYLVHVPVIATVAFLLGDEHWVLVAVISVPTSVVLAWLFHAAVERPSHALARRAGSRASSLLDRVRAPRER
ncbi:acyltransferase family protein [Okibacterium endophyticum]